MKNQTITFVEAWRIAEENIRQRIARSPRLSRYDFADVELRSDEERYWLFVCGSEQLQAEGCVPGALHAAVDKTDGHVWTNEEFEQYCLQLQAAQRTAAQPDSAAA